MKFKYCIPHKSSLYSRCDTRVRTSRSRTFISFALFSLQPSSFRTLLPPLQISAYSRLTGLLYWRKTLTQLEIFSRVRKPPLRTITDLRVGGRKGAQQPTICRGGRISLGRQIEILLLSPSLCAHFDCRSALYVRHSPRFVPTTNAPIVAPYGNAAREIIVSEMRTLRRGRLVACLPLF